MPTIYKNGLNYGGVVNYVENPPAGIIQLYGKTTPPPGWLVCDGTNVNRALYSELFAAIGTTHGAGDGSTTFTLPDFSTPLQYAGNSSVTLTSEGIADIALKSVPAGTWLVNCRVRFAKNTSGYRTAGIYNGSTITRAYETSPAVAGSFTFFNLTTVEKTTASSTAIKLRAIQNSGSSLSVTYDWTITSLLDGGAPAGCCYIISTGKHGGADSDFEYLQYESGTGYYEGINDEYTMLPATIEKWEALLQD